MALWNGIDTTAFVTNGVYSSEYGSTDKSNIANLFVSYGLVEDAPTPTISIVKTVIKIIGSGLKKLIG